jgi:hypothetical protein
VVARTHEHTLWTRLPEFAPEMLYAAQRDERSIFEYWGHAMSYLPMQDYRYYLPTMRAYQQPEGNWAKNRYEKYGHLIGPVLERIKQEGPLRSRDFMPSKATAPKTWWDWRPEKNALELLLWRGDLMVSARQGFQKIYDLTENVLPDWVNKTIPTEEEVGRYVVGCTLKAYGVATEKDMHGFLHETNHNTIQSGLNGLLADERVTALAIESLPGQVYYMFTDQLETMNGQQARAKKEVHILSPFDNLIIQRERVLNLFDFQYSLECYLPMQKRIYGYYVMPILYGADLIGRLDPKADRKQKEFQLRSVFFDELFFDSFAQKVLAMMQFNGCEKISVQRVVPDCYRKPLKQAIRQLGIEVQEIQ